MKDDPPAIIGAVYVRDFKKMLYEQAKIVFIQATGL